MSDLIRRDDALAVVRKAVHHSLDGNTLFEDQNGPWLHDEDVWVALNALPAVTMGVPCTWPTCGHTAKGQCNPSTNLAALEPVAAPDPAAIREAALHVENAKRLRRYDWQEWTAQDIEDAEGIICAFLALIQKGADHE